MSRLENAPSRIEVGRLTAALVDIFCRSFPTPPVALGARDRADLVTDDVQALKERLEAVTGERISALEGIGESVRPEREREHERDGKALSEQERPSPEASAPPPPEKEIEPEVSPAKAPEPEPPAREKRIEMDMGL